MQINFSKTVKYVPTWRGNQDLPEDQQFSCELTVLNMAELMSLLDSFTAIGLEGQVDTDTVENNKIKPVIDEFGTLLPSHVQMAGLNTQHGAVSVEDIVTYPIYLNLALELLMKLSEISSPSDDDVGNLSKPSA